jgi:hypothetical protein
MDRVMPEIGTGDTITLRDKTGEPLGELTLQELRCGAWCGIFAPALGYARVRDLFVDWTRLVNDQCLSLVDAVDGKISAIGIVAFRDGLPLRFSDVQIYDEGDQISGSIRLVP